MSPLLQTSTTSPSARGTLQAPLSRRRTQRSCAASRQLLVPPSQTLHRCAPERAGRCCCCKCFSGCLCPPSPPMGCVLQAVAAARLPAVKASDKLGSWCSRERPIVVDIGAGIGGRRGRVGLCTHCPRREGMRLCRNPPRSAHPCWRVSPFPSPLTPAGLHAALSAGSGCTVVLFEPLLQNAGACACRTIEPAHCPAPSSGPSAPLSPA